MPDVVSLKLLGVAGIVSYAAARLVAKAGIIGYSRCILVAVPTAMMPAMPKGFRVEPVTLVELAAHEIDVPPVTQQARFEQGMTCLAAFNRHDELVGVTWVGPGPYSEDIVHLSFEVPTNAAWDTGLWIAPRFRLGRGFAALWAGTADWLRVNGRSWSMSWIADYNLPSLQSHKRMGAVTVGQFLSFRFGNWQYVARGRPKLVRIGQDRPAALSLQSPEVHAAFSS
jgi:hypothetical protein